MRRIMFEDLIGAAMREACRREKRNLREEQAELDFSDVLDMLFGREKEEEDKEERLSDSEMSEVLKMLFGEESVSEDEKIAGTYNGIRVKNPDKIKTNTCTGSGHVLNNTNYNGIMSGICRGMGCATDKKVDGTVRDGGFDLEEIKKRNGSLQKDLWLNESLLISEGTHFKIIGKEGDLTNVRFEQHTIIFGNQNIKSGPIEVLLTSSEVDRFLPKKKNLLLDPRKITIDDIKTEKVEIFGEEFQFVSEKSLINDLGGKFNIYSNSSLYKEDVIGKKMIASLNILSGVMENLNFTKIVKNGKIYYTK